jgi:hypothetical protein
VLLKTPFCVALAQHNVSQLRQPRRQQQCWRFFCARPSRYKAQFARTQCLRTQCLRTQCLRTLSRTQCFRTLSRTLVSNRAFDPPKDMQAWRTYRLLCMLHGRVGSSRTLIKHQRIKRVRNENSTGSKTPFYVRLYNLSDAYRI